MPTPLRVLVVEDSEDDTLLLLAELLRGGFAPVHERVETADAMRAALARQPWDIVLADHRLPRFSGPEALKVLHEAGIDLPFIVVTGTVSEEEAIRMMRAGAHDFILKGSLGRLVPAVQRELREAEIRRERQRAAEEREDLLRREREARARAEEANAAKDRFLGVISHELRNPLAAVLAGVGLLRHRLPKEDWAQRTLEIMERNIETEARLIANLLDFSRMVRGELALVREPMLLDPVVRSAVEATRTEAQRAGVLLDTELRGDGLWVCGDAQRLEQSVGHLIANAIRFTPAGGRVCVRLSKVEAREPAVPGPVLRAEGPEVKTTGGEPPVADGEARAGHPGASPSSLEFLTSDLRSPDFDPALPTARIVVEDTGAGIAPELMPRLFHTFERGEMGGSGTPGLGTGLALVKWIVQEHDGRVSAESAGRGHGSRFLIELPLIAAPEPAVTAKQ